MKRNRGNAQSLVCPWFSMSDRRAVYLQLFEGNHEEKLSAIRRLDAWKARSYIRVPLGIEVTVALIEALTWEDSNVKDRPTPGVLASMYCMSLVRFVNLVTEVAKRNDGFESSSIQSIAEKVGVPEWIVNLRHTATHSVVPSLHILKIAAVWCLDWVKLNYWIEEDEFMDDVVKMPAIFGRESVQKALHIVKADLLTMSECDTGLKRDTVKKDAAKNRLAAAMKNIIRSTNSRELAQMLLSDGLIFPESQLSILHSKDIEADPFLATYQFNLWWPVLHLLGKSGYLVDLIVALISEMNRRPSIRGKFASTWITLLITKFSLPEKLKTKDWKGYINLIRILLKSSPAHVHLAIGHLPKEKMETLTLLASKKAALTPWRSAIVEEPQTSTIENDHLMKACPLGLLPEQLDSATPNLELPMHVDSIFDQEEMMDVNDLLSSTTTRSGEHGEDGATPQPLPKVWLL